MDGERKRMKLSVGYLILGLWAVLLVQQVLTAYMRPNRISYTDFKTAVAQGKVEEAAIGKTMIQGRLKAAPPAQPAAKPTGPTPVAEADRKSATGFETVRIDDPDLLKDLAAHGVRATGVVETTFWRDAAGWLIPIALIGAFWMLMIRRLGQAGQNG